MSSPEHKKKIWNYIKKIKVGMLTTHINYRLHSRPMYLVQDEYDGRLWFFTQADASKTDEVREDQEVCVTFADADAQTYVSLSGTARITNDAALKEKFWSVFVASWYPEGKDSSHVALIEIKVAFGEHWDGSSSRLFQVFEMAKANLTHTRPTSGENQKFGTL